MTWAAIFRHYYEGKGWDPERIKAHTPGQLAALSGKEAAGPSFKDIGSALAWAESRKSGSDGGVPCKA